MGRWAKMQRWKNAFYLPEEYCFSNSIYSDGWWEKRESKWMESTEKTLPSTAHTNDLMKCNIYKDFVRSMIFFSFMCFFFWISIWRLLFEQYGRAYIHQQIQIIRLVTPPVCVCLYKAYRWVSPTSILAEIYYSSSSLNYLLWWWQCFFMPLNSYDKNSAFIDS